MLYVKNLEKTFNIGTDNEIKIFEDLNLHIEDGNCLDPTDVERLR